MQEHSNSTIQFIPERINRQPTVFRGMTMSELFIVVAIGAVIGGVIGGFFVLLFNLGLYIILLGMGIVGYLSIRIGGMYISRLKRGRPDTWFERFIEFKRSPSKFVTEASYWSIHRSRKKGHF
ncbi:TIGR03750 family conjugal transfer protein [Rodentibacter haemolyticus]|uniref:TIGR03750 family conjugal transfer protein n=1 Tax=Rodentibacter haemolyticus TaxID=2778911 RepID=A0ABX6UXS3_9PAST|nr:TIGR03750 family conjugal transfer protein [Rodentibacter haemolyticus]QPB42849.1 TIGR03750 family conjugal transfer protein [Rodentibacter haemolyticus]